ncbi:MAG: hypothetical protein HN891_07120 [Planctomycetes bacterium]|nr:hypothetical protein [Planctomycetota bacterium]MBT6451595.1 hypothetical protein [Planctomycetota bacterium]MBT6540345.1 hypothetical protein [Planctomycetota bacterium]MBT6967821.1 hypothetical protein [Planctomycetota bacterium]MBT7103597.1 hypothetical protein [Planctomycetota bacterium]
MMDPSDRKLWLLVLALPFVAWLLIDPRPAPTVISPPDRVDPPPVTVSEVESHPILPPPVHIDPPIDPQVDPPIDPEPVVLPVQCWVRGLSAAGELLPEGTELPLETDAGTVITGAEGVLEVAGEGLRWISSNGRQIPVELPPGQWILDCTAQLPLADAPVQLDWVILVREEEGQSPARLVISGTTPLPVGMRLLVKLSHQDRILDGGYEITEGESVWWNRVLVSDSWFAGCLAMSIEWDPNLLRESQRSPLESLWRGIARGEIWSWQGFLCIDDPQEARRQQLEISRWYAEVLEEVQACRDLLLVASAKARGKKSALLRDPERADRVFEHPLAATFDLLGRGKSFDYKRWRRLLDEVLPQRWSQWSAAGRVPYPHQQPAAAKNVALLFNVLVKYSRLESTVLYEALGKPRHIHDFVANFDWEPVTERKQTLSRLRNFIEAIRQSIWK